MVGKARFQDRLYFCSDGTAARGLGVSRQTIIRARVRLEDAGRIMREGKRKIGPCKATIVYSFPAGRPRLPDRGTQRSKNRTSKPRLHFVKSARTPGGRGYRAKWRETLGDVVPIGGGAPEKSNVSAGQALFAAIVDELAAQGVEQIPRRLISTAAKHGSEALKDGVEPEMVLIGCVMAIQKGTPQYASHIIGDCVLTKAGKKMSQTQYNDMLNMVSRSQNPAVQRFRQVTEEIRQREEQKKLERGQ